MSMPMRPIAVGMIGLVVALGAYVAQAPGRADVERDGEYAARAGAPTAGGEAEGASQGPAWDAEEWRLFHDRVRWALEEGLDTASMGTAMAALGRTFVGTPYAANTLEASGPEHLVVRFDALDCVTFVETVFTLARFVRGPDARDLLEDRQAAEDRYEALLTEVRYRGGVLGGYASRLHYFSEWIADNQARGLVRDLTRELGGERDPEAVDFMTTHADAYRQLGEDPSLIEALRATEARLTEDGRWALPEARVADVAPGIRDGDIIAATSTVQGLDVAHTGLALWVDGALRLMHAPLVGDSVQISPEPLAQRLVRIESQDGIMVARPCGGASC